MSLLPFGFSGVGGKSSQVESKGVEKTPHASQSRFLDPSVIELADRDSVSQYSVSFYPHPSSIPLENDDITVTGKRLGTLQLGAATSTSSDDRSEREVTVVKRRANLQSFFLTTTLCKLADAPAGGSDVRQDLWIETLDNVCSTLSAMTERHRYSYDPRMSAFPFLQHQLSAAKARLSTNAFKRFVGQVNWLKELLLQHSFDDIFDQARLQGLPFGMETDLQSDDPIDDDIDERADDQDGSGNDDDVNDE